MSENSHSGVGTRYADTHPESMRLSDEERSILDGKYGDLLASILAEQLQVGEFFGAEGFVEVTNAHFMGDPEVFGKAGLDYLERLCEAGLKVRIPTTRNASCSDMDYAVTIGQSEELVEDELRTRCLLGKLGLMTVNTCIGYQSIYQPMYGEHVAWGDTGTVVYANSVLGARTNYEAGPASLAAALTGRTPAYGFHLNENRRANVHVRVRSHLKDYSDWGALGGIVGARIRGYENVPVFDIVGQHPTSDDLKHLGASLASFGSLGMFHMVDVTPEARTVSAAINGRTLVDEIDVNDDALEEFFSNTSLDGDVDLVVFTAPQLSVFELQRIARSLEGKRVADSVQLIITTNSMNFQVAEELGFLKTIQSAGGMILSGTCWYLMDPVAQRERFGWRRLVTNSAKLVNIVAAHGYQAALRRTDDCVEAALSGRLSN